MIISLHIYKTAGSTFLAIIDRQYKKDEIIYANIVGINKTLEILKTHNHERNETLKIVHGHFAYGWHKYFSEEVRYITFLRNPVDRIVSDYYYNRSFSGGHNYKYASKMTLKEYIMCDEILNTDNGQTRFVAGDFTTPHGKCSELTLHTAIKNIENHFAFVGLMERFDESLLLANYYLGWKKLYYEQINVTKNKEKNIDQNILELIRERNQQDILLYEYVVHNFQNNLNRVPFYNLRYSALKGLNLLYNKIHPLYKKVK